VCKTVKTLSYVSCVVWILCLLVRVLTGLEQCVSSNREDWGRKCNVQRRELSDCAEEKYVPLSHEKSFFCAWLMGSVQVLGKIKRECQKSINDYDKCLAQNKLNPSKCIANLRNVSFLCWDWM